MPRSKNKTQQGMWPTYCGKTITWRTITSVIILLLSLSTTASLAQGQSWERRKLVGLAAGTCIREGPGFGYRAHTRVPEDNWMVMIIDGPRTADSLIWWDTSRKAAGDPSGGTGWVTQDQRDTNCDSASPPTQPPPVTPGNPGNVPVDPRPMPTNGLDLLQQAQTWWYQQPALVKWGVAVLALLFLSLLWRLVGGIIIEMISAAILALIIWVLLSLTRPVWQDVWQGLASLAFGGDVPDLALLLAVLPLASWAFSLILRSIRLRT